MKTKEIRERFLKFFEEKDHLVLPSFSLIPQDDPTLLLIGAGMAPLKPYFTGEKNPPHPRIATCQKCVRTPDIERVGKTSRHATFFEMLGNFSFGDYFKREAIAWAWELVTQGYMLPEEKLYVSVYEHDDEAYDIWQEEVGIPEKKIYRLGKEDNFWEIGQGPCGPCSEIYYDLGFEYGCGRPDCQVGCDCDRYVEVWNLVFTQFNRDARGEYHPLENKNIDTGAGLERMAMALQNVPSFYDIDIVRPILEHFIEITGVKYGQEEEKDVSLRILTEHLRSITFMVVDGVLPSNEGRGYVLRRIIRRAVRHGKLLGLEKPFLYQAVPLVVDIMHDVYPELKEREEYAVKVVQLEEERFQETLEQGLNILSSHLSTLKEEDAPVLSGEVAFKLYDTFGFPLDLTREIVEEKGMELDEEGFEKYLQEQRERARAAQEQQEDLALQGDFEELKNCSTRFIGYERTEGEGRVLALIKGSSLEEKASPGEDVNIILDLTPFYGESGGQVGDRGFLEEEEFLVEIHDVRYGPYDLILHKGKVEWGEIKVGDQVKARVEEDKRCHTCRNHTATHLLHKALKEVLGEHVNQAGSLVSPERLRFDFTHFAPLEREEIKKIEDQVNRKIWENIPVEVEETTLQEAMDKGAMALFEGKYDEGVRMVRIRDYSLELCGGTHTRHTGEIGLFKIVSESGIGTGLRRIEALTGPGAYDYFTQKEETLKRVARELKTEEDKVISRLESFLNSYRELEKENQRMQQKLASSEVSSLLEQVVEVEGIKVLASQVESSDMEGLRSMVDQLRSKMKSGVVVLGSAADGKVLLVAMVTKDLTEKGLHAGKIIGEVAKIAGGGGGGRPDMAQAGAKEVEKLPEAMDKALEIVKKQLS
ncbi:MAG: alanine--tRNA ligase [Candidatus Syntrophonatronum acetioxidans]|uniref:Alanine--tRNA ligase n=1 Tax=Candidatus Syntrophonatronum acetioxidans TaxID=1795816 RepID=A0A424YHP4_9FIRM|nr:MAG: alanine--tRNA ligase [Candidatus Syntrophonatronum acetioxidans]